MSEISRLNGERDARSRVRRPFARLAFTTSVLVSSLIGAAYAAPVESEAGFVEAALARPEWQALQGGREEGAQSELLRSQLLANPTLSFERDRTGAPSGDVTENTVRISQPLDISGRRSLYQSAAQRRVEAVRLESAADQRSRIAELRILFAEALHQQYYLGAVRHWQERIESAARIAGHLARAGEVSGYEQKRIEQEAKKASATLALAEARQRRQRESLAAAAAIPPEQVAPLVGTLVPDAPPPLDRVQDGVQTSPELASMQARADAFGDEAAAASRAWIPGLSVDLAHKQVREPGRSDNGVIVGLSLTLPLFDRGQADQAMSRAQARVLRAQHQLSLAETQANVRGVWQEAMSLHEAASTYRKDALASTQQLSDTAEAAYRAGESSLLELLDAYRAEMDALTTELDLSLRARLARIELDRLYGATFNE
ncbi:TolC family protein [Denitromonas sp.]|uniref:TolC family protein n=1 Tax=Denitromonas sp. TaxID=2734609 RepID=UPI002AFE8DFD|nr:TolC family protein [Denitromonas sp.]